MMLCTFLLARLLFSSGTVSTSSSSSPFSWLDPPSSLICLSSLYSMARRFYSYMIAYFYLILASTKAGLWALIFIIDDAETAMNYYYSLLIPSFLKTYPSFFENGSSLSFLEFATSCSLLPSRGGYGGIRTLSMDLEERRT